MRLRRRKPSPPPPVFDYGEYTYLRVPHDLIQRALGAHIDFGESNPFEDDEDARDNRRQAALRLLDDDTWAFMMLRLRRTGDDQGEVEPWGLVPESVQPVFQGVLALMMQDMSYRTAP